MPEGHENAYYIGQAQLNSNCNTHIRTGMYKARVRQRGLAIDSGKLTWATHSNARKRMRRESIGDQEILLSQYKATR